MILIKCFTDPICTWCWGSEPILRKLETHFAHQIQFEHIMGGLVDDIKGFMDEGNGIGGSSAAEFNRQVAEHWLEASAKHKMPVNSSDFDLFSDEYPSTFPQNIAYKAAQLSDESKADLFLYNLRLASAAEARKSNRPEVLLEIAAESQLDVEKFATHLKKHSRMALEEIRQVFDFSDLAEAQKALEPFALEGQILISRIGNGDFAVLI